MIREVEGFPWETEFDSATMAQILRGYKFGRHDTMEYTQTFYTVNRPDGTILLAAGVAIWSFVRQPELWLILAKPFFANLRESVKLTSEVWNIPAQTYPNLICEVRKDSPRDYRFAEHFGWQLTGQPSLRLDGEDYIQFGINP